MGITNPKFTMEDIEEEGSSIGSSLPGTPLLSVTIAAQEQPEAQQNGASPKILKNLSPGPSQDTQLQIVLSVSQQNCLQNVSSKPMQASAVQEQMASLADQESHIQQTVEETSLHSALPKPVCTTLPTAREESQPEAAPSAHLEISLHKDASPNRAQFPDARLAIETPHTVLRASIAQASQTKQQTLVHTKPQKEAAAIAISNGQCKIQVLDLQSEPTEEKK